MAYLPGDLTVLFEGEIAREDAPYVGVVGPPGCGKTRLLTDLEGALGAALGQPDADAVLRVSLSDFPVSDGEEMLDQLALRIRGAAPNRLARRLRRGRGDRGDVLALLLDRLLERIPGRVTLMLDGFDRVPRSFARSVSRRFRGYWEDRDRRPEYGRLGVVIAGALSLLDLKREVDSAISLSRLVVLPWADDAARLEQVRDTLVADEWPGDEEVLQVLARETGGEPAFLDPVLREVEARGGGREALDGEAVQQVVEDTGWMTSRLPVLESVLLGYCGDEQIRQVVHDLCERPAGVPAGPAEGGVDRLQLMGCVVRVDRGAGPSYRFRNAIVERFFRLLAGGMVAHVERAAAGWVPIEPPAGVDAGQVFARALRADRLRAEAEASEHLWGCLAKVRSALEELAGVRDSRLRVAMYGGGRSLFLFDGEAESVSVRPRDAPTELTRLVEAVRKVGHPVVGLERKRGRVAVPLRGRRSAILIAELPGEAVAKGFSESSLAHWGRWVMSLRRALSALAESQLAVTVMDGKISDEELGLLGGRPRAEEAAEDPRLPAVRRAHWRDAKKELDGWRMGLAVVLALTVFAGLYTGWDLMVTQAEVLGQIADVMQLFVWVLGILVLLIFGKFGKRIIRVRDEWERGLVEKIFRRRLSRAHLVELLGETPPPDEDAGG